MSKLEEIKNRFECLYPTVGAQELARRKHTWMLEIINENNLESSLYVLREGTLDIENKRLQILQMLKAI